MATYDGAEAVYDELGGVLSRVFADPARLARMQAADAIVRFELRDPEAKLTLLARVGAPGVLATGETDVRPDVVLMLEADMLRGLMFGERTPMAALTAGEIALKGSVAKLLRVLEALVGASEAASDADASEVGTSADAEVPAASDADAEVPADGADGADAQPGGAVS